MLYYVSLYPTPSYMRHFIVEDTDPHRAVYQLNYFARLQYNLLIIADPKDEYRHAEQCKHIIKATRRYKRHHSPTWMWKNKRPVCVVSELLLKIPWEGHLNIVGNDRTYAWNILSPIQL